MSDEPISDGKAGFDHIYDQPDPREYYRVLGPLDYEIPQQAQPTFHGLLDGAASTVLDLCCSYGVNAALLRCRTSMDDLVAHYDNPRLDTLSPDELRAADRDFYTERLRPAAPTVLGLDLAENAVGYARDVGLLADGWSENLEADEPSEALAAGVRGVDLITITGGVGYVTERTFDRLLSLFSADRTPAVAAFVLRRYSFEAIAEVLREHGLRPVDTGPGTYPQRRFVDAAEEAATLDALAELGIDPAGKEAAGAYHTDLHLWVP